MFKLIITIFSVTALAQLLQLSVQPMLTFLYSKDTFGHYSVFFSLFTFLSVICLFQYNNLVLIVKEKQIEVLNSGIFFVVLLDFFVILSFIVLYVIDVYKDFNVFNYISLFLLILFYSISSIFRAHLIRANKNKVYSYSILIRSFSIALLQITFGFIGNEGGLIYGVVLGELISLLYIFSKLDKHVLLKNNTNLALKIFMENKHFLIWTTLQEIVAVFSFIMPVFLVNKIYGFSLGGEFSLAHKLVWSPAFLISQALSPVILKSISEESKDYLIFFDKKIIFLFLFLFLPVAYYSIDYALPLIINDEWKNTVWISQLLLFWVSFFIISIPSRLYLRATNRQKLQLILDVLIILIFSIIFFSKFDLNTTLKMLVFFGAMLNLILFIIGRSKLLKDSKIKYAN